MPTVLAVVGARPNFVKMAPVTQALAEREGIDVRLLHTGQHYDRALSDGFIERLGMPQPDANLGVGLGQPRRADREGDDRGRGPTCASTRPTWCWWPAT